MEMEADKEIYIAIHCLMLVRMFYHCLQTKFTCGLESLERNLRPGVQEKCTKQQYCTQPRNLTHTKTPLVNTHYRQRITTRTKPQSGNPR